MSWPLAVAPDMLLPVELKSHLMNPELSTAPKMRSKLALHNSLPAAVSHKRARPSAPTDNNRRLSPLHAQSYTCPSCASMLYSRQFLYTSQIRIFPVSPPIWIRPPSKLNFIVKPLPSIASSRHIISPPVLVLNTAMCSSSPLLATIDPSGEIEQHNTDPRWASIILNGSCLYVSQITITPFRSPEARTCPFTHISTDMTAAW
mmetsp:Transcript_7428/g.14615  ORF Transcript_7428/g.14615 Transcript_7428/m.14615 type:complete len:203 (-) Transcript_7428:662-1270(-)